MTPPKDKAEELAKKLKNLNKHDSAMPAKSTPSKPLDKR